MADNENTVENTPVEDQEMGEGVDNDAVAEEEVEIPDIEPDLPVRETFLDFLRSPVVQLVIGTGEQQTTLTAHQALLQKSPYLAERCAQFPEGTNNRVLELPDEDIDAIGSFLEYLYNGEYFPRRISSAKDSGVESDPSIPSPDDSGNALLRHARVYAIADKFGVPALKSLAHSKIHRTSSTAKGEIAYARFVYKETKKEDQTLRRPIAAFWATKSHILRHGAEDEFRGMCLEYPQFAFDVLTIMLDQKEKKEPVVQAGPGSSRKRARQL